MKYHTASFAILIAALAFCVVGMSRAATSAFIVAGILEATFWMRLIGSRRRTAPRSDAN